MKTLIRLAVSTLGFTALHVAASAQEPPPPPAASGGVPYVGLAGAGAFLSNVHVHPMDQPQSPGRAQERFNIGEAGAAVLGYAFGNGFQVELEGALEYNNVHKLSPVSPPGMQSGNQTSYGFFVNGEYVINPPDIGLDISFVKPYIGLGVGALWTHTSLPEILGGGAAVHHIGGTSGPNFAAQTVAGLAFPIAAVPGLAAFVQHDFVAIPDRPGDLKSQFFTSAGLSHGNIKLSPIFLNLAVAGVAYAFAPPPAPLPGPAPAPVAVVVPSRTYLVFFDWDRAELTDRARQIVAEAASASTHVQTTRIEVNGYTDLSGTVAYNQGLSDRRARAVAAELVRLGVPANEISIRGFGESNPLVKTAVGVREPQNRRVEIILK